MNSTDLYDIKVDTEINSDSKKEPLKLKFYFESIGSKNVVKAIEYSCLGFSFYKKPVYNLGFGDYDHSTNNIRDTSISNNGDVYKVFNTVLSTAPLFFELVSNGLIFVKGSDSNPKYFKDCITTCHKKCTEKCKNIDRRISIYRRFINKHYTYLSNICV
ncbi:MAG TPA: hypothetical protein VM802_16740 [Chitinophaga sp.]|uniref:DUF6934 family protein n=1 Tax=Chitinophaga sp. TaxID=1869181 RepID=UPI002D0D9971|nr:hypothetical protein [Chitinophaga sp.]HVI46526.1 hypothetical protein [Chitinophaga sp.]